MKFFAGMNNAGQHRKRGLHRLDEQRVFQRVGHSPAVLGVQHRKRDVGLGADLRQYFPRVQLVLAGQHRIHRRAGPAHALCQHGSGKRPKLLMV